MSLQTITAIELETACDDRQPARALMLTLAVGLRVQVTAWAMAEAVVL